MFARSAAFLLHALATALTWLPWPLLRRFADALAWPDADSAQLPC